MTPDPTPPSVSPGAVLAALAETLDIPGVLARFGLTPVQLRELLHQAAQECQKETEGTWSLYVDGASRGNPGPAGAGAVLRDPTGHIRDSGSRYLGRTTNNVAEYQALLLGLELARRHGVRSLDIFADSELLVRQLTGRYRVRSPHLRPLYDAVRQTLSGFAAVRLRHLERSLNREADRLANQAIDLALKGR